MPDMKKSRIKTIAELFLTMFRIGLFTFGGGYAMIALLENEFVSKKQWLEKDEFLDMTAIAESTPGPIAINSATYIGYRMAGVGGSAAATVGVVLPSFIIIYLISLFFDRFLALTLVSKAFRGIQVCVIYLILSAGLRLFQGIPKKPFPIVIFSLTAAGMLLLSLLAVKFSTIFFILAAGVLGLAAWGFRSLRTGKNGKAEGKEDDR